VSQPTIDLPAPDFRPRPAATVVTGAAGWLGQGLIEQLGSEPGRNLRCLVRSAEQVAVVRQHAPDAKVVVGDIRDPSALDRLFEGFEGCSVFHAAAVIHPTGGTREFFDCNVGGTSLVLDRAQRLGASRVVHVSSNSPFGFNRSPYEVFREDAEYRPVGGYGQSKMEAEQRVMQVAGRGALDTVVVRAPWFYGPNQPARQTRFFTAVRKGRFPLLGDGSNRRSMVYLDNLVQGLLRAERREGISGRAFWIADSEPYPMTRVMEAVKAALAKAGLPVASRQLRVPSIAADVAERVDLTLQGLGRYSQTLHVLSEMNKTIACSIDEARDALQYEPDIAVEEGMQRSVEWCVDNGMRL
jgi:nucleoside-diphosphate-sugar epimerase